jgi:hypothetical protein
MAEHPRVDVLRLLGGFERAREPRDHEADALGFRVRELREARHVALRLDEERAEIG